MPQGDLPVAALMDVGKSFAGVPVLHGVNLVFKAGSVHALMGENGAGKSTAMRVLAGLLQPNTGSVNVAGRAVQLRSPHHAASLGIAMIHQEPMIFPALTVAENIFAGREPMRGVLPWLDRARMHEEAEALLKRVGAPVRPEQPLAGLSVAVMQAVEIARAVATGARLIIMDEPTSALSAREADALFTVIAELRKAGTAVVYISHKLDEVFRLSDMISVLRDGRCIATRPTVEWSEQTLITAMVGREITSTRAAGNRDFPGNAVAPALNVIGLTRTGCFANVTFSVRRGEVLGLAGLMGAGRTDVAHAIYGLEPAESGDVEVNGSPRPIRHPSDALACGVALVGEDRRDTGFVPEFPVRANVTLAALHHFERMGFIDGRREAEAADDVIRRYAIKTAGREQTVGTLSGGNQQKVVIARALLTRPSVLILDEPTRGIDIGAKEEVYAIIRRLADAGMAVLLISSELPELLALSDRIVVMRQGRLVAELASGRATQEEILRHAMPGE